MRKIILYIIVAIGFVSCSCSSSTDETFSSVSQESQREYWIEDTATGEKMIVDSVEYAEYYQVYGGITGQLTNVQYREVVRRDTILAKGYVSVKDYVGKDGIKEYYATWCSKRISIKRKAAEEILAGKEPYVVLFRYNNGEVIRHEVIIL